ncbi:hypothetical protein AAG570_005562, partial [Ranatra chinensis]
QEIVDLCNASPQCIYAGFDPTANSLHIGNLFVLIKLMHWQRAGHQPIALIGGATARVGDPSGKTKERDEQNVAILEKFSVSIEETIKRLFDNHEKYFWDNKKGPLIPIRVLNNADWFRGLNVIDFVSTFGRNFRMGTLLSRKSVESRINSEAGMNFAEFSYQLFQAFDWLHLVSAYDCKFQVGGCDQMGNIMSGHELISRVLGTKVYGFTVPLITSETGDKYGKTGNNAIWLEPAMTSPFELYQFFIRLPDADIPNFLKYFTFLTLPEVEDLIIKHVAKPEKRIGQKILAEKVTQLVYGQEGLDSALKTTAAVYDSSLEKLSLLNDEELASIFKGATEISMLLDPGMTIRQMVLSARCFLELGDAERIIRSGGLYINHQRVTNPDEALVFGVHILPNYLSLVRVGE